MYSSKNQMQDLGLLRFVNSSCHAQRLSRLPSVSPDVRVWVVILQLQNTWRLTHGGWSRYAAPKPPKCEAWGGLKYHARPWSLTYFSDLRWSISLMALSSSDFPPTKLVPRSHLSNNQGLWSAKKCLKAQMKELVSMDSRVSIGMAQLLRQVNTSP